MKTQIRGAHAESSLAQTSHKSYMSGDLHVLSWALYIEKFKIKNIRYVQERKKVIDIIFLLSL